MPSPRPHPIVITAAALVIVGAGAAGVWAGSMGAAPRPQPVTDAASLERFLPAGDSALSEDLDAQHGAALFEERCTRCHTIGGGDRIGPDLAMAALRRDPSWLRAMVAAPDSMFRTDSVARWVLDVHDIAPADVTADNPDLRALAAFLATFDLAR